MPSICMYYFPQLYMYYVYFCLTLYFEFPEWFRSKYVAYNLSNKFLKLKSFLEVCMSVVTVCLNACLTKVHTYQTTFLYLLLHIVQYPKFAFQVRPSEAEWGHVRPTTFSNHNFYIFELFSPECQPIVFDTAISELCTKIPPCFPPYFDVVLML